MIKFHTNIDFKLNHQYHEIRHLLQHLSSDFINKRHNPEKWSIHEIIAHLGRYQEIFEERLELILKGSGPQFERYKADEDGVFRLWVAKGNAQILEDITNKRSEMAIALHNLNENDLRKTGVHPVLGSLDLFEWTQFFIYHESHHLYQIFWLIKAFDKPSKSDSID